MNNSIPAKPLFAFSLASLLGTTAVMIWMEAGFFRPIEQAEAIRMVLIDTVDHHAELTAKYKTQKRELEFARGELARKNEDNNRLQKQNRAMEGELRLSKESLSKADEFSSILEAEKSYAEEEVRRLNRDRIDLAHDNGRLTEEGDKKDYLLLIQDKSILEWKAMAGSAGVTNRVYLAENKLLEHLLERKNNQLLNKPNQPSQQRGESLQDLIQELKSITDQPFITR